MHLIPAGKKRRVNFCELQAILVYTVNSRIARDMERDVISKKKKICYN